MWTVTALVSLLLGLSFLAVPLTGAVRAGRMVAAATAAALAVCAVLTVGAGAVGGSATPVGRVLVVELFLAAVVGGGPVTAGVLALVDGGDGDDGRGHGVTRAGEVLRGGAWIGVFERCAVFGSIASGWPEGLAVILALKGLGRYSELRAAGDPAGEGGGVAERFIIGTFASVLWAGACAGMYLALTAT